MLWRLYSHAFVQTNDPRKFIAYATTTMARPDKKYEDPVRPSEAPSIVRIDDLHLDKNPAKPIVKMTKREHADNFFRYGILQLGSFEYYARHENPEVRDIDEGVTVIVGQRGDVTTVSRVGAGYNYRTFCCFTGRPSQDVIEAFGYDTAYEVVNPHGFKAAIARTLQSTADAFGQCRYVQYKVVQCALPAEFRTDRLDSTIAFAEEDFRYFLKSARYEHQSETRFIWKTDNEVNDAIIICCPEAIQYCRRLE